MTREYFFDEVKIHVRAGRGGDGCVSFRREKGVPRGGPDGGDGGDGGSIILKADRRVSTLAYFHDHSHFVAENGAPGSGKNKKGKKGQDIILNTPPGTVVKDEQGNILADLDEHGKVFLVARGGRGGKGNASFKTPVNQAPRTAEKGESGETRWLKLELKLIADVGIVGLPNAGKSTLLSRISSAHPKIAPYPFTTLRPHLGIVKVDELRSFIAADLPGLIEKASEGKGLGHRFLRHVERSKILLHLIDVGDDTSPDPVEKYHIIIRELENYNPELLKKPQIVAGNKIDLPGARERLKKLKESLKLDYPVLGISAKTGEGLKDLIFQLSEVLWKDEGR